MKTWKTKSGYKIIQILSGNNVFLLTNGEIYILIDTSSKSKRDELVKKLKLLDLNQIDFLILTHTHYDHAGNSNWIKENYNAQVIVHSNEASYLATGENILPQGTFLITRIILKLFSKKFLSVAKYEPCGSDLLVDSVLDLSNIGFNACIMHTPGHTSGCMSVIIDNEIAIVGDTMFGVFKWSVFPPYANDVAQMINSWEKLLETGCSVFIPGHGSANDRSLVQKNYNRLRRQ